MSNIIHLFNRNTKDAEASATDIKNLDTNQQMSLPFNQPHVLYVVIGDIESTTDDFLYFTHQKGVTAFFDLRFSPRLDFVASTRQKAFTQLQKLNILYYDAFGRSGTGSLQSTAVNHFELLNEIVSVAEKILRHDEPALMFFDNYQLANEFSKELSKYFDVQKIDGKYITDAALEFNQLKM